MLSTGPSLLDAAGLTVSVGAVQSGGAGGWDVLQTQPLQDATQSARQDVQQLVESVSGRDFQWPDRYELLGFCRESDSILAAVLLFLGIIYSAFGYTIFKLAVTLNVAGLGVWAGWFVGKQFDARLPAMVIGGVLFAALAWPAMRFAVAVCGGLVGFVIGVAIWRSLGMADNYAAAGGAIGAVFLFMLSFSLFKVTILTFTAIQGAVMLLAGLLGLLLKYPPVDEPVSQWLVEQPALLPITLLSLSLVALLFQQQWHRQAAEASD